MSAPAPASADPSIVACGDAALMVVFGERVDRALNDAVHGLAAGIEADRLRGRPWGVPVPAYASLLVPYDPLRWLSDDAARALQSLISDRAADGWPAPSRARTTVEIPVRYGGDEGPDLAEVAQRCGLSPSDVIDLHSSSTYHAYFLGFAPGFAYLGTLPRPLGLPRRDTPRQRVPSGSVAIAGHQTAVYPSPTPGGWHIIGRTDVRAWDPARERPALIEAGSEVRFVALDR